MKKLTATAAVIIVGLAVYVGMNSLRPRHPNIVVLMLDTLRADHMGVFGYERETSPNLDRLARENVLFRNMRTPAPWTPPAVASIFTGLYPVSHGMIPPNSRQLAKGVSAKLPADVETIAEALRAHGYATGGVNSNPWTTAEFGFDQGFDEYYFRSREPATTITKAAKKVLDRLMTQSKPFFLYVHYLDPHDRGNNPEADVDLFKGPLKSREYSEEMLQDIGLYDGKIHYLDRSLGELFSYLKEKGVYDDARMIVVADHGEQFRERGNHGHGFSLFDEELHPPLIMKDGGAPREVQTTVSLIDIKPTVLEWAGIENKDNVAGLSLLHEDELLNRPGVMSEIIRVGHQRAFTTSDGKKLILDFGQLPETDKTDHDDMVRARMNSDLKGIEPTVLGVFEPATDKFELTPSHDERLVRNLRLDLEETYAKAATRGVAAESAQVKSSTMEDLRSLGYAK